MATWKIFVGPETFQLETYDVFAEAVERAMTRYFQDHSGVMVTGFNGGEANSEGEEHSIWVHASTPQVFRYEPQDDEAQIAQHEEAMLGSMQKKGRFHIPQQPEPSSSSE